MADENEGMIPDPPGEQKKEAPDVSRMEAQISSLTDTLENMKKNIGASTVNNNQPQTPAPSAEDLKKQFWKDPLNISAGISQVAANQAAQNLQAAVGPTITQMARDQVRASDPEVFDKYEAEVVAYVQKVHPSQHMNIEVWKTAFSLAKGNHIDDIIALKASKSTARTTTTANDGPSAPSPKAPPAPKVEQLTEEEKDFTRRFQMSEEAFRRGKARINNQHDGKIDKPSFLDGALTFDSRSPRPQPGKA